MRLNSPFHPGVWSNEAVGTIPNGGSQLIITRLLDAARIEGYYARLLTGSILVGIIVALAIVLLSKPFGVSIAPALSGALGGVAAGIFAARLARSRRR